MPDEQIEQTDVQPKETADDKALEEMDKILDTETDTSEPSDGADTTSDGVVSDEEEAIPTDWIEAGYAAGLGEDVIVNLAETNPAVLKALAEFRGRSREVEPKKKEEPKVEIELEAPKALDHVQSLDLDFKDDKVKQFFSQMVTNQNQMIDYVNKTNQELHEAKLASLKAKKASDTEFDAFVDNVFDSKVKECPAVGLNKSLTEKQLQTRQSIQNIAKTLPEGDWKQRIDNAVKMWNAAYGVSDSEMKMAAKLDGQKKRFVPRPGGQKSKDVRTAVEKGMNEFDEIFDKYGVKSET